MRPRFPLVLLLVLVACSTKSEEGSIPARTERERDSILGNSQLPGARVVHLALGESDSAAARNARLDSVANQP
jgi:hypothetical protein